MHPAEDSTYLLKVPSSFSHEKPASCDGESPPTVPADCRGNQMLDPFDSLPLIIITEGAVALLACVFFSTTSIHQSERTSGEFPHSMNGVPIFVLCSFCCSCCCLVSESSFLSVERDFDESFEALGVAANAQYRSCSSSSVFVDSSGIVCLSCFQKVVVADVLPLPRTVNPGTRSCRIQSSMSSHVVVSALPLPSSLFAAQSGDCEIDVGGDRDCRFDNPFDEEKCSGEDVDDGIGFVVDKVGNRDRPVPSKRKNPTTMLLRFWLSIVPIEIGNDLI